MKLTGQFNPEVHAMMVKNFGVFAKTWPFALTGFSAETLRALVGIAECFFGALALCPLYTRLSSFIFSQCTRDTNTNSEAAGESTRQQRQRTIADRTKGEQALTLCLSVSLCNSAACLLSRTDGRRDLHPHRSR